MHHCLLVSELVEEIVSHLSVCHQEMVDVSLVCWSFYEPAMNRIWDDLWDISPLLRCLPRHTWTVERTPDENGWGRPFLTFVSVPLPHEWARFQHHASRVKALEMPINLGRYVLHQSCFDTLQHCPTVDPLPSLTCLSSTSDIPANLLPVARLFLPKTLVRLRWSCSTASGYLRLLTLLNTLDLPCLRQLIIVPHFLGSDEDYVSLLPDMKVAFHELHSSGKLSGATSITINGLCRDGLRALAMLPCLRRLDLALDSSDAKHKDVDFEGEFRTLSELSLRAPATERWYFIRFLRKMHPHIPRLLALHLALFASPLPADACTVQELFESIALIYTLESLSVSAATAHAAFNRSQETVGLDALVPLFRLRRLLKLELACLDVSLGPADVEEVAKGLPRIERLSLGTMPWSPLERARRPSRPLIFAQDLLPFAVHCPSLSRLGISIQLRARARQYPRCISDLDAPPATPPARSASVRTLTLCIDATGGSLDAKSSQFLAEAFPRARVSLVRQ
ncbi:myo-inositol-1-phosphate synthases-like protein [Phanerochaete sordida]|uniref:Myo-inositol-1-phosphate synthases-like protein n=1 Tax=Phanerochaete sordida TaxID=48140 RepID=A0A9P3FZ08_9APHY|nr:myo-inositol-1-phosphate synthases-like protein [Phanerochaete sordida]